MSVKNSKVSYISLPINSGIGAGMQTGFLYAKKNHYDYAIQFDGDGQHSEMSLLSLLNYSQEENLDLCVGSRFIEKDNTNFKSTFFRRIGIKFFANLISILTGVKVTDPTSGYRVYGTKTIAFFAEYYPDDYPEPEVLFWCAKV